MAFTVVGSPNGGNGNYERNTDSDNMRVVLPAVLVPLIVLGGVAGCIVYYLIRKRRKRKHNLNQEGVGNETQQLDNKEKEATTWFSLNISLSEYMKYAYECK